MTEQYLAAILDQLGQVYDRLPARSAPERPDGTVELVEPEAAGGGGRKRTPAGTARPAQRRTRKPGDE